MKIYSQIQVPGISKDRMALIRSGSSVKLLLLIMFVCVVTFILTISFLTPFKLISDLDTWSSSHGYGALRDKDPLVKAYLNGWAIKLGYGALRKDVSLRRAYFKLPGRWLQSKWTFWNGVPKLDIDIKFKNMQRINEKRAEALAKGVLIRGADDFVPASIRYGGRTIKVKMRLKGDWTDHLEGNKWSFRIRVRKKDQILGMRRFSIQNPKVRGYQGEILFFEVLRYVGVLVPRYFFVDVRLNGDGIGIMALEEHFSKELLESNGRRESVIIRFDESLVWAAENGDDRGFGGVFDDYRNAPIDAFRSSRVAKSKRLTQDYTLAVGLLRGFVNGELQASKVFDVHKMGNYLAAVELLGTLHSIRWHNQRFYFNPIIAKLEPIGFDADLQHRSRRGLVVIEEPIVTSILSDPKIFAVYREALQRLAKEVVDGNLVKKLKEMEKRYLLVLKKEFYLLESFPYDELKKRANYLLALVAEDLRTPDIRPERYPILIHAYKLKNEKGPYLEVANAIPHDVEVQAINWIAKGSSRPIEFKPASGTSFPLFLQKKQSGVIPEPTRIYYQSSHDLKQYYLQITATIRGKDQIYKTKAQDYYASIKRHPIPETTVDEQLRQHSFLTFNKNKKQLIVKPGQWEVRGSLIVPKEYSLTIPADTTLRFDIKEGLFSHGPLILRGREQAPIILEGKIKNGRKNMWQGIVVLRASHSSEWSHVTVSNTSGISRSGWQLTGGVTFYESDIFMNHSRFQGNRAEDALNIIHSKFILKDTEIVETLSDGLDADFSEGTVEGGLFRDIGKAGGGGDAIDISGSIVKVIKTRFVDISDKALSVGERSKMSVEKVVIERPGTGAASKDGSRLDIKNSSIKYAKYAGLMAYVKKQEYGPGHIEASNIDFTGSAMRARVQKGSSISIDNKPVKSEDIDVKELYQTIMKPGLRQ